MNKICLVIGDPINHSLSPLMHNVAFKALGIDEEFKFVAQKVGINELKDFIKEVKEKNIKGVSVTIPLKIEIMKYLDLIDEVAKKIGAVNTVLNEDGILKGYNSDWLGVIKPLENITDIKGKKAAVIGAGGAARAIVYGLQTKGCKITIFNRSASTAKDLADYFGCDYKSLNELEDAKKMDIIINTTPLGMGEKKNETPVPKEFLNENQIVFDTIYNPKKTRLLKEAKIQGANIIYGLEMLLYQGIPQFELYTGKKAPAQVMRKALEEVLR